MIEKSLDTVTGLSKPAIRALNNAGYYKIKDLNQISKVHLLSLHGFGPKAIVTIEPILKKYGMSLSK